MVPNLVYALALTSALGATDNAQSDLRAAILLRAMAYERTLSHAPEDLRLVVLGAASGMDDDATMMDASFKKLAASVKIAGRRLVPTAVRALDAATAAAAVREAGAALVYVAAGAWHLARELKEAQPGSILLCGDVAPVGQGCLMAVDWSAGKPRIVLHLGAVQQLGLNFDSRLLQLATTRP